MRGFHGYGSERLGWNAAETALTPEVLKSGRFGPLWQSEVLDDVVLDGPQDIICGGTLRQPPPGRRYAPHLTPPPSTSAKSS